jgi:putative DNA primase/helicase
MQQDRRKSLAEIRSDASGNWPYIFADLCPELGPAMEAGGDHVPCPVHGGTDGFRLYKDWIQTGGGICNTCGAFNNGLGLMTAIKEVSGAYTFSDALREVASWLRGEEVTPTVQSRPPPPPVAPKLDPEKARRTVEWIRRGIRNLEGTPAEKYLLKRGIWCENQPHSLRFHPGLRYYHGKPATLLGEFPAMVAPVTNTKGEVVAVHRTFITADGDKAPVPDAKKLTSAVEPLGGSAIRLFKCSDVLGIGEGIETVLAARAISRMPVWSAANATLLELVEIPEIVRHVVIWADLDVSGRGAEAADKLGNRLVQSGRTVEIQLPEGPIPEGEKGIDWLDVLITRGVEGFPAHWRRWRSAA